MTTASILKFERKPLIPEGRTPQRWQSPPHALLAAMGIASTAILIWSCTVRGLAELYRLEGKE